MTFPVILILFANDPLVLQSDQSSTGADQNGLAWVLNSPLNTLAIVGCSSPERVHSAAQAASIELTHAERNWLVITE